VIYIANLVIMFVVFNFVENLQNVNG
jgi:hypothetical protein